MIKAIRGRLVTPFEEFDGEVVVEDGVIKDVVRGNCCRPGVETLSYPDCFVCPGFVDLHIHGAAGSDFLDCSESAFDTICRFIASHGVTTCLGTATTGPMGVMARTIEVARSVLDKKDTGLALGFAGLHLEGPHISETRLGAQDGGCVVSPLGSPIPELVRRFASAVRTVTIAPELPEAESLVRTLVSLGIHVSAGHTDARFDLARDSFDWGIDRVTHLFNAMHPLHHREPGLVGAALSDSRVYVELIADLVHIHPAVIELVYRLKGRERVCLVTDSIRATGLAPGRYTLGRLVVTVDGGQARLSSGALAGSLLTMDQAVRNVAVAIGLPLSDAIMMASYTPAKAVGLDRWIGSLQQGKSADIVVLSEDLRVEMTMLRGQQVYRRSS